MERLAAGGCTDVDHLCAGVRVRDLGYQHGADILHGEKAVPESIQFIQTVIPGDAERIRQVGMGRHLKSFRFQLFFQKLRRRTVQAAPDGQRLLRLKVREHGFDHIRFISLLPQVQDPFRTGIPDGQFLHPVLRVLHPVKTSGHGAEHPVHISPQPGESFPHRQLHRLAAHRMVRHAVHILKLVDRAPQDPADHRLHFLYFYF